MSKFQVIPSTVLKVINDYVDDTAAYLSDNTFVSDVSIFIGSFSSYSTESSYKCYTIE